MILEQTLHMLQTGVDSKERAGELGRMGFMQWLGGLDGKAGFAQQAARALAAADMLRGSDPAVEVFCGLVEEACRLPPRPLELALPKKRRRGGASSRRRSL